MYKVNELTFCASFKRSDCALEINVSLLLQNNIQNMRQSDV